MLPDKIVKLLMSSNEDDILVAWHIIAVEHVDWLQSLVCWDLHHSKQDKDRFCRDYERRLSYTKSYMAFKIGGFAYYVGQNGWITRIYPDRHKNLEYIEI